MESQVSVKWDDLLEAFALVNMAKVGENEAHITLGSGEIHTSSVWTDLWDTPEESQEPGEGTLAIPHKTELGLGRDLVLWFVEEVIPDRLEDVEDIFAKPGAYGKFKALLSDEELLQAWYEFEKDAEEQALRSWCEENGVSVVD